MAGDPTKLPCTKCGRARPAELDGEVKMQACSACGYCKPSQSAQNVDLGPLAVLADFLADHGALELLTIAGDPVRELLDLRKRLTAAIAELEAIDTYTNEYTVRPVRQHRYEGVRRVLTILRGGDPGPWNNDAPFGIEPSTYQQWAATTAADPVENLLDAVESLRRPPPPISWSAAPTPPTFIGAPLVIPPNSITIGDLPDVQEIARRTGEPLPSFAEPVRVENVQDPRIAEAHRASEEILQPKPKPAALPKKKWGGFGPGKKG
jgi:hypothetical protein